MDSYESILKNFDYNFNLKQFAAFGAKLTQHYKTALDKSLLPKFKNITSSVFVAGILIRYSQLNHVEKCIINQFLNIDASDHLKSIEKEKFDRVLFRYCPKEMITMYENAEEILKSQTSSKNDEVFFAGLFKEQVGPFYEVNPHYKCEIRSHIFFNGTLSVGLSSGYVHCNTERRTFSSSSNMIKTYSNYSINKKSVFHISENNLNSPTCVDIVFTLKDLSTVNETDRSSLHTVTKRFKFEANADIELLHKIDGRLNWFLVNLRNKSVVKKLQRRAAKLCFLLRKRQVCDSLQNDIASFVLLHEHRYAGAFLYRYAPHSFRNILATYNILICLPIMIPVDRYGRFSFNRVLVDFDMPIFLECEKKKRVTDNVEEGVLSFEPLPTKIKTVQTLSDFKKLHTWSLHTFDVDFVISSILLSSPAQIRKIKVTCEFCLFIECDGDVAFVTKDEENHYWYCFSLKKYTSNVEALHYVYESSYQVDPPLDFKGIEDAKIQIEWENVVTDEQLNATQFYCKTFNILRQSGPFSALLQSRSAE